jgi:hypothetical protein
MYSQTMFVPNKGVVPNMVRNLTARSVFSVCCEAYILAMRTLFTVSVISFDPRWTFRVNKSIVRSAIDRLLPSTSDCLLTERELLPAIHQKQTASQDNHPPCVSPATLSLINPWLSIVILALMDSFS